MAKEVRINRVECIERDGGGFRVVLVSGNKRIPLHFSRHVLLAGTEMAKRALVEKAHCVVAPLRHR